MARYDSILDTIGRTPLVRLDRLAPAGVNLYVKLEAFNPMGSVKDRMALAVIEQAERDGALRPGQTVIEATSGNTGIGLAMVCARKGYPLVVTMAESFSVERRKLLRLLGARVVLTPAAEKGTGMLNKAVELAERHGYFLCRQFENEANAEVHSRTTAREILDDFRGDSLHAWVTGFGTGGTLKGVARVLKQADPTTRVVVAEPDNAALLGSGIAQPRDARGGPSASHPRFRPHLMQGWSPDFISRLTEDALAAQHVDEVVPVAGDEELALSRSTPGYRFDAPAAPPRPAEVTPASPVALDPQAERFVDVTVAGEPVVMFTLEWCEFCWSVRKFFARLGIEYRSVDLDAVVYQAEDLGGRIRAVLAERTGAITIPRIFVGGEPLGGCTELFDAWRDGSLGRLMEARGIAYRRDVEVDPYDLLPGWLHPRTSAA